MSTGEAGGLCGREAHRVADGGRQGRGSGRPQRRREADLVFANGAGGASYIYWASDGGFHPHKRLALPTSEAAGVEVEDINRDGSPDLVFAQQGDRRTEDGGSLIYWGGDQGFSRERKQTLPTWAATGIAIGDLDSDGKKDLVFANKSDGSRQVPSLLYWGAPNGRYSREARLELGSGGADAYAAADIDRDGFPDLFLPEKTKSIYWGAGSPIPRAGPPRWTPSWRYREGSPTSIETATWTWR